MDYYDESIWHEACLLNKPSKLTQFEQKKKIKWILSNILLDKKAGFGL